MDLGARAARALRWAAGATAVAQLVTWAMTILVIRLLSPSDYGLMAMATVFVSFLMIINELGLGAALVQQRDLNLEATRRIFGATLLVNTAFMLLLMLAAPLFAVFFGEERLTAIIRVLAVQFVISAFEVVPVARLERELNFKRKSLCNLVAAIGGGATTLVLAWEGFGVWSLVYGNLTLVTLRAVGYNVAAPFPHLPLFGFAGIRGALRFGGFVMLERAMWSLYSQADVFIVGKLLGAHVLGIYAVAMHLASLIMHKTGGVLYEVAFPTFSRAQEQGALFRDYLLRSMAILAVLSFPVFVGIASVAPELVAALLGASWEAAVPALALLSLVMPIRMASNLLPPALQGVGRPDVSVQNLLIALIVMPIAFAIGTRWGLEGVCLAWLFAFPLVWLAMLVRSRMALGVEVAEMLRPLLVPAACATAMFAAVSASRPLLEGVEPAVVRLASLCALGAAVFLGSMTLVGRERLLDVLALARR
jgi:O-antigen/teichoic acid export membrane protein